ncbi:exonuclease domain-containing protein [Prauserella alba]|uniref:Exonuclease domain-containing protein n=1 Tax=Prauserella alba TaxID=176898 RepID=A0ABP4FPK5_9PSEU|nr:3'-5' exonuclease [Prauserella alba]MCP2178872.1 DNA polymerase-3 subunit epsilon [Prauserella alba]
MFAQGQLTRSPGVDPRSLTFAAIDLETTGLEPAEGARVCEIGIVRMRGDGVVLDEYSTLVNPQTRITNDEYHDITDVDVQLAPTFAQISGDVLAYLDGAIVVSHNLEYEEKFLDAEFGRLGIKPTGVPGLCTLITTRVQLDQYGYRLGSMVNLLTGEWSPASHSALGDARALAAVLAALIGESPQRLAWSGPAPTSLPQLPRGGPIAPRAAGLRKGSEGWLATLTARLPYMPQPPAPREDGLRDYRAMLGHALADGKVVGEEATQLATLAARAGLTQLTARRVHESFLAEARARAEADGTVTTTELRELRRAAKELASSHLISDLEEAAAADRARRNGPLKGWRLLAIDDSADTSDLMDFAVGHGATSAVNVTKTVNLVITHTTDDDPRIGKAQSMGIDVVSPGKAREILDGELAAASSGLFANAEGEVVAEQLTAEREAQKQAAGSDWHQYWRPRELTPAEYREQFIDRYDDWDERRIVVRVPASTAPTSKRGGCAVAAVMTATAAAGVVEVLRHVVG